MCNTEMCDQKKKIKKNKQINTQNNFSKGVYDALWEPSLVAIYTNVKVHGDITSFIIYKMVDLFFYSHRKLL